MTKGSLVDVMNVRRDNVSREPTYPKEGTMSQQRTLPTARDLAYMHDAQAHLLRARIGVEDNTDEAIDRASQDREAFDAKVQEYEAELGLPTAEEIEVFLSFTNLVDLGPIGAVRAFGMLVAGLLTGQFEKAIEAGWDPDERREEVERTFTKENMEKARAEYEAQMENVPQGIAGLAAALGIDLDSLGADEDSEPDVA